MKIRFFGAAGNVTGSRFFLESKNSRLLIDCGLYQERQFIARNWDAFPVSPLMIDNVVLTHAHIDHCGYLPKFVKDGFKGKIFCTEPTADIAKIALLDSARLQEDDAEFKRKRHRKEGRAGRYPVVPLYTVNDARDVFGLFAPVAYDEGVNAADNIKVVFHDAGHILGASMIEIRVEEDGKVKKCIFSGDIGRWEKPILKDPSVFENADYVFMESTYGNRLHGNIENSVEKLRKIIVNTAQKGGNIIIPVFGIERAQELLYWVNLLLKENKIPPLVVFLDSPMAIDVTKVFKKYPEYFDEETKNLVESGESPFGFSLLKTISSINESKAINSIKGSSIIMAGSGMCTGGRIKHHLVNNIARPESTIVFVGYQAEGTLGRQILERPKKVRIFGHNHRVSARIEKINGFSAHADKNELLKWVSHFKNNPQKIFIIHGEKNVAREFASVLSGVVSSQIIVPDYLEEHFL
ncbi:MAG: MBL fold hydrolase [Candidatus Omnitrophica bacterium CG11_big_fil_rev_8_21_14_0_20_42_13]|uniref:MBL fold hydrolase n=1 Tax=Candidatus Ghiorseimicrobium undicola TaxID=1974746 RepID=A0A2H0M0R6_9BACT|nr:MAG: MBL fold hydrolase [Candidatus Omnitrophica bacterium CG11_big_fil_rev_8_21_14_0_20_42_13]